jgi:UDP-GlcNAc3NAcA epimerase
MIAIIGTRPQIVKAAILSKYVDMKIIYTGQHYDQEMFTDLIDELGVEIFYNTRSTSWDMVDKLSPHLTEDVLVFGDTRSTICGALAAKEAGQKLIHIEAGVRSGYDMPEERYRKLTDHLSDVLLCPTQNAVDNLCREGLRGDLVGDVMYDAIRHFSPPAGTGDYTLVTIHRQENMNHLEMIFSELNKIEGRVVFPMHPRTRKIMGDPGKVEVVRPVTYLEMLSLEQSAKVIVTDSGGVQREAYYYGVPCVVVRKDSEWNTGATICEPREIAIATKLVGPVMPHILYGCENIKNFLNV